MINNALCHLVATRDLAKLYQCKNGTKEINQAVKNNPDKFPERFSWRLTKEETQIFLVENFDQKIEKRGGYSSRFPEYFYFQFTLDELNNLKFQFETSSWNNYGGVRKSPYAYTE